LIKKRSRDWELLKRKEAFLLIIFGGLDVAGEGDICNLYGTKTKIDRKEKQGFIGSF
jgi:hypothetical protein